MAKIWVEAYGCSASYSDSEMISGLIVNGGHTLAENSEDSDLNVIVTCSVKDATADKMIRKIMDSSSKPLVVAACEPNLMPDVIVGFAVSNGIPFLLQVIFAFATFRFLFLISLFLFECLSFFSPFR